jgi:dCMP deaminase
MANWDQRYMSLAQQVATWSKDPSTKVGCVIYRPDTAAIISLGYNGFPRGIAHTPERDVREVKLTLTVHAELNAILNAARNGAPLEGTRIVCTFFPCVPCACDIIQSGITTVVAPPTDWDHERWGASQKESRARLEEAGINLVFLERSNDNLT